MSGTLSLKPLVIKQKLNPEIKLHLLRSLLLFKSKPNLSAIENKYHHIRVELVGKSGATIRIRKYFNFAGKNCGNILARAYEKVITSTECLGISSSYPSMDFIVWHQLVDDKQLEQQFHAAVTPCVEW